jgi:hypothetical protein
MEDEFLAQDSALSVLLPDSPNLLECYTVGSLHSHTTADEAE